MNIFTLFQHLSPEAQILLLLCLLVVIIGMVIITSMIAFSQRATRNICKLILTISHLLHSR